MQLKTSEPQREETYLPSGHTTLKWRRINVDATWLRRIDVDTTSFWCCVPIGFWYCVPNDDKQSAVLLASLGKTFFAWCFILNRNTLFWLTISYQKPFAVSESMFCSQICTLILNCKVKNWSDLCNFYSKVVVAIFYVRQYVLLFMLNLNYLCFATKLWNLQNNWTSGTCWKSAPKLPTLQSSA